MKRITILVLSLILISTMTFAQKKSTSKKKAATSSSSEYAINKDNTTVKWTATKVGGSHTGMIQVSEGKIIVSNNEPVSGAITINVNSMTCTDLENKEYNEKLILHLKNEDFFNTAKYPKATLQITKFTKKTANEYSVTGNMILKGKTAPITFPAIIDIKDGTISSKAKITFDRTKYNIKYGSSLLGIAQDKVIHDDIVLDIELNATKK